MMRTPLFHLCAGLLAGSLGLFAAAPLAAQDKLPRWRIDPVTKNHPRAMERLGYVSFGPFPFGERNGRAAMSAQIEELLPNSRFLWVETAHFRIGAELDRWHVRGERDQLRRLREELEELKKVSKSKAFNPRARSLEPWIRLHLMARRLEAHYAELQDWLGVTDEDFPPPGHRRLLGEEYMGEGPFLGEKNKFLILITQQGTTLNNFLEATAGRSTDGGQHLNFRNIDALFYGASVQSASHGARLSNDFTLHAHLVFAVTKSMLDGYRHYNFDIPIWISEGVSHWFERRTSRYDNTFTRAEGDDVIVDKRWDWQKVTKDLIARGGFTPFSEVFTWRSHGQMGFVDHVLTWSRWDFLMSLGKERFAEFMGRLKGRTDAEGNVLDGDLVGYTRELMREVYGLNPLSLDDRWLEWVRENY